MASGVGVNPSCLEAFQSLKLGHKHTYIIYSLSKDYTEVVVEKTSKEGDYETFLGDLPENECRWAVYDFGYEQEGGKRNKLIFYSWAPDTAKIRQKMLFASSKDALRRSLLGIGTEIQATDISEVSHESVLDKVTRSSR